MDKIRKAILISILSIAAISWVFSYAAQDDMMDMMNGMMLYDPLAISLFAVSWIVMMAAMIFPVVTPMVLHYNGLVKGSSDGSNNAGENMPYSPLGVEGDHSARRKDRSLLISYDLLR